MDYLLKTLAKLVSFDTDSTAKSNYLQCAKFIASEAGKIGLKARIIGLKGKDGNPRPNVLIESKTYFGETVLLMAHYDCVPCGHGWKTDPLRLTRKGDMFYGRGVCDDKGAVACSLAALKEACARNTFTKNVKLFVACDEEVGGEYGAKLVAKKYPKLLAADYCIAIDGDLDRLYIGCSGIVHRTITLRGKGGHAGYDFETDTLLHRAIPFLAEFSAYKDVREKRRSKINAPKNPVSDKLFGRFNITMLNAGEQHNIIPRELEIGFDMRLVPEENAPVQAKALRKFLSSKMRKFRLKGSLAMSFSPGYFERQNGLTKKIHSIASRVTSRELSIAGQFGGTDARYIHSIGIPSYCFGPGGNGMHTCRERISVKDLETTKWFVGELVSSKILQ